MRTILVDWLAEVAEEFRLHVQTLHRAVGYVDRFLSSMAVIRGKLQLVGVTCLMLAAKYEEVSAPIVDDYVFITDNTYSRGQVLRMEHVILRVLAFDLGGCTAFSFLERFLDAAAAPKRVKFLALYLCELSLLDGSRFLPYLPATIAAASVSTAMFTCGLLPWTAELEYYTRVPRSDVQVCISDIISAFREAPNREQHFVYNKYRSLDFMAISTTPVGGEEAREGGSSCTKCCCYSSAQGERPSCYSATVLSYSD
jgi:cyclin A